MAHEPGPWFDETLRALADQQYPALRVVVVDTGSPTVSGRGAERRSRSTIVAVDGVVETHRALVPDDDWDDGPWDDDEDDELWDDDELDDDLWDDEDLDDEFDDDEFDDDLDEDDDLDDDDLDEDDDLGADDRDPDELADPDGDVRPPRA